MSRMLYFSESDRLTFIESARAFGRGSDEPNTEPEQQAAFPKKNRNLAQADLGFLPHGVGMLLGYGSFRSWL